MKSEPIGLASSEVLRALREAATSEVSLEQRTRLLSRLDASLLSGIPTSSSGAASHAGWHTAQSGVTLRDRISAQLAAYPVATVVSALVMGGALGGGAVAAVSAKPHAHAMPHGAFGAPLAQTVRPVPWVSTTSSSLPVDELPLITTPPALPSSDKSHRKSIKPMPEGLQPGPVDSAVPSGARLSEQLALLETARSALRKRDAGAALQVLQAHELKYPESSLIEEREALTIRALQMSGRVSDARKRLSQFEQAYPASLLLPVLRSDPSPTK